MELGIVRLFGEDLGQLGDGAGQVPGGPIGQSETQARLQVLRRKLQCARERLHGLRGLAEFEERDPQVMVGLGEGWVQPDRLAELVEGVFQVPPLERADSRVIALERLLRAGVRCRRRG